MFVEPVVHVSVYMHVHVYIIYTESIYSISEYTSAHGHVWSTHTLYMYIHTYITCR